MPRLVRVHLCQPAPNALMLLSRWFFTTSATLQFTYFTSWFPRILVESLTQIEPLVRLSLKSRFVETQNSPGGKVGLQTWATPSTLSLQMTRRRLLVHAHVFYHPPSNLKPHTTELQSQYILPLALVVRIGRPNSESPDFRSARVFGLIRTSL